MIQFSDAPVCSLMTAATVMILFGTDGIVLVSCPVVTLK